mgnify:CR=1 FL=1
MVVSSPSFSPSGQAGWGLECESQTVELIVIGPIAMQSAPDLKLASKFADERVRLEILVPSWLLSIAAHVVMFFIMALVLKGCGGVSGSVGPKAGDTGFREIGLHSGGPPGGSAAGADQVGNAERAQALPNEVQPVDQLPFQPNPQPLTDNDSAISNLLSRPAEASLPLVGPGSSAAQAVGARTPASAGELPKSTAAAGGAGAGRGSKAGRGNGPGAGEGFGETTFFDIAAKGNRFVYVLDRSGSMYDHGAIRVAKEELVVSLAALEPTQQFQLVFYNQSQLELTGTEDRPAMQWATDINRTLARQFISHVQPDGGTDHLPALKKALRYHPENLFLLTDADQPIMSTRELNEIKMSNNGRTKIHCVEFGKGPELSADNFLKKLARDNGGTHRYRDVTQFGRR